MMFIYVQYSLQVTCQVVVADDGVDRGVREVNITGIVTRAPLAHGRLLGLSSTVSLTLLDNDAASIALRLPPVVRAGAAARAFVSLSTPLSGPDSTVFVNVHSPTFRVFPATVELGGNVNQTTVYVMTDSDPHTPGESLLVVPAFPASVD